ncbi:hypothetical protein [Agromyces archimandritae]|uniref:Uncharacterized protein n=1 Tax=Agromyces archimandritae TaxID=2781962 RepID=A0A975IN64_9MICO|nr:hypothetical protein [Agromyces archimandritae]QTX04235.1 hypothetical protein G127AT_13245 [Agromyces archimandritae]
MSESTITPGEGEPVETPLELKARLERERKSQSDLAPEEESLKDWLPRATPTDGPAPAP